MNKCKWRSKDKRCMQPIISKWAAQGLMTYGDRCIIEDEELLKVGCPYYESK